MPYMIRALAVLLMVLMIVVGCSRASRSTRASEAPSYPTTSSAPTAPSTAATTSTTTVDATPIAGHPPITTAGVVAKIDPQAGVLVFQDGRTVKLTDQTKVLAPVDVTAVRPGTRVVVRNAKPVAVPSAKATGKRQKMGTVASVDKDKQIVRLSDGSSVRVSPSTEMHMGMQGVTVVLTDLKPGDERTMPQSTAGTSPSPDPSALPRSVITGAPSDPSDASELMVFREVQAP